MDVGRSTKPEIFFYSIIVDIVYVYLMKEVKRHVYFNKSKTDLNMWKKKFTCELNAETEGVDLYEEKLAGKVEALFMTGWDSSWP